MLRWRFSSNLNAINALVGEPGRFGPYLLWPRNSHANRSWGPRSLLQRRGRSPEKARINRENHLRLDRRPPGSRTPPCTKTARPHRASSLGFLRTVRWRGLGVGSDGPGRRRLILGGCQCSARSGHPTRCEARRLVGEAKPNWPRLNFDSKSRNRTLLARHRSPSRSGSSRHAGGRRGHCHGMNGSPRKTEIGILTAKRWGIRSHEVPFVT